MDIITNVKLIAETITAICAAIIVLRHLVGIIPKPIKIFFSETVPLFFCGLDNGKNRIRFFKALRFRKEQKKQFLNIVQALHSDCEQEEIFILNKRELVNFLCESKVFTKVIRDKGIRQ